MFGSWRAIEGATLRSEVDAAIDSQLSFTDAFRDFAVRNAQPAAYIHPASTGLEEDRWQTKANLADFPSDPHVLTTSRTTITLGEGSHPSDVLPLTAQYDEYEVVDDKIRQIEIDITELTGAGTADLDVLAQIRGSGDSWRRFESPNGKVKLCRDVPSEDVHTLLQVVISNHAVAREGNLPDPDQRVRGNYKIEAKDECEERELHIGGVITYNAEARDRDRLVTVSGKLNVVFSVKGDGYLLTAERDDGSTYAYDYADQSDYTLCPSSHEKGTLETFVGVPDTEEGDWSIGQLNPIGQLGEDLSLMINIFDYCGPPLSRPLPDDRVGISGFPHCANRQVIAEFDGTDAYIIECDVTEWGGIQPTASFSGRISGILRPLDGPHP